MERIEEDGKVKSNTKQHVKFDCFYVVSALKFVRPGFKKHKWVRICVVMEKERRPIDVSIFRRCISEVDLNLKT